MADAGPTPPPKDVVTTRTPTPTSPPADHPGNLVNEVNDSDEKPSNSAVGDNNTEQLMDENNDGTTQEAADEKEPSKTENPADISTEAADKPVTSGDVAEANAATSETAVSPKPATSAEANVLPTSPADASADNPDQSVLTPQADGAKTATPAGSKPTTPKGPGSKPVSPQPTGSKAGSPQPTGSKAASPQPTGSKAASPQPVGSKAASPQPTGSKAGSPQPAGSKAASPQPVGSKAASPQPTGSKTGSPQPAGSKAASPQPAGSKAASPQPVGSKAASPQPVGSKAASPQPTGSKAASPQPTGSKAASPQPTGSKPTTPQADGSILADSKSATPQLAASNTETPHTAGSQAATPLAAGSEPGNVASAPSSLLKQVSEIKGSPPPPPTAEVGADRLTSAAESSELGVPEFGAEKTSLSVLSEADEANMLTRNALNMIWSFGLNKNVPMVNLSTDNRSIIMYACAHTGVCYNFESNTQKLLQGHNNNISSTCVSEDKRWLATADKGPNNCMVIVWDTSSFFPVQTIFEAGSQGVVAMAMTPDARYLATISADSPQVLCIWDWTVEGDAALCSATLDPSYGVQNFVLFNPDDTTQIVSNSESQVIFYAWGAGIIEYFCPPLTDDDFNKPVGKYTQSIFLENTNKCLTATSIGNLVVWASNKPLTKAVDNEPTPNKKALKLVKVQDRGINVLMVTDSQIVMGDMNGHVKLFDHNLNLVHWYQDLHVGPINAISFTHVEKWGIERMDTQDYPNDCSLVAKSLAMRNFVIGSTQSIYAQITPKGTDIQVILRSHDSPIHSVVAHPCEKKVFIASYSGLLQIWNYESRNIIASRRFDKGYMVQCVAIDPKGHYVAVGFTNGVVKIVDALNLQDEDTEPFRYARDAITHIQFSPDSQYLATADGECTTTLYKRQNGVDVQPWIYIGRHKAHYKEIKDLCFGVELDSDKPRLLSLGKDRNLVEYDLENSSKDNLKILSVDRIEQSAMPQCITWFPPLNKEHFLLTANDQFKFKLYNVTTKRCRKTVLAPTYGSPLQKICILPAADKDSKKRYLAYINKDKIGLHILPLDGNPHNSMALVAHPSGVTNMAFSFDGKYLFTSGGPDTTVHMWHINLNALEAQSKLGGEDLIPFYGLMEGGREGELFAELEDYFYYGQLRHQGINTMMKRQVDVKIALSEVPYVMRAMGFYPSEQEVEDMLNEVKFSQYVETGEDVTDIDLGDFIKLYINHRPAFGLSHEKIAWCFEVLSGSLGEEASIKRGQFLDLLQRKGEHMTEYELSEYLTTLLGFNEEGGSCEQQMFDPTEAGNIIVDNLPVDMSTKAFTDDLLGFGFYQSPDILTLPQEGE